MNRTQRHNLDELAATTYDLLIVGGGINGAGIAREAAMRGLKVVLIEKNDFAFGTSSRSTKLAHGGLRYLETREFSLVRESLRERGILMNTLAPHLVKPMPFWVPFHESDQRPAWMVKVGLWIYDVLAFGSSIQRHRSFSKSEALRLEPSLAAEGFKGAAQYWDCQMNDARLVLENILDAERFGARCLNYTGLLSCQRLASGAVRALLRDEEAEREAELSASWVINAAGPWVDSVLGLLGRSLAFAAVKPTKGVHLVTRPLTKKHALLVPARGDSRVFFIIPASYGGRAASLIGTTDTDFYGDKDHVLADPQDVEYLLSQVRRVLPSADLKTSDIWASYAGLRPLSAPDKDAAGNSKISRESQILEQDGLLSLTGGKFTTYRCLAEKTVNRVAALLKLQLKSSFSANTPLPGAPKSPADWELLNSGAPGLAEAYGVSLESAEYLLSLYGVSATAVLEMTREDPDLKNPVAPGSPAILAQVVYAARHEKAEHLVDFYLRRTFLGLELEPDHFGVELVASCMGAELNWNREREADELEHLKQVIEGEYRISI
jgi:glycerol-3-phosphate dehydrogenase